MFRIPFFSKKPPPPEVLNRELDDDLDEDMDDGGTYYYKRYNKTPFDLVPGDIVKLSYVGSVGVASGKKVVLITATQRGRRGNFLSTRDNDLLCCFELNPESFVLKIVLKLFYKKENRCQYKLIPSFLKFVFGLSAFKTLDFKKISQMEILLKR